MLTTIDKFSSTDSFVIVPDMVKAIQSLKTDDQLGLLWILYENMGGLVTPADSGATERIQLAGGFVYEVASLPHEEQLQFMRHLIVKVETPLTRSYTALSSNNKLAFWYQLAEWMRSGEVVSMPESFQLSKPANAVLTKIVSLDFNRQVAVLRLIVGKMGIDSFDN